MGPFEAAYEGSNSGIDLRIGPKHRFESCKDFGDRLWADVARIISFPADRSPAAKQSIGYSYEFSNTEVLVSLYVDDGEPGWPFEVVPAMLSGWSLSEAVETWELVERLYNGLVELGEYQTIAFDPGGMPITANFDIGDDW
ncbi:hypothetical protein [Streptomyces sp. NPDC047315]|uniref:hypothetical protein n=1 Tax=Streptomyces sp. NPDC047315 TaxID=3155142 RepID=UPI0033D15823